MNDLEMKMKCLPSMVTAYTVGPWWLALRLMTLLDVRPALAAAFPSKDQK